MKIEIPVEFLQPWSTFVMKTQLPPPILEKLIKITDEIIEDQAIKSENIALSDGLLEDQFKIREEKLEGTGIVEFCGGCVKNYIIQAYCQAFPFKREKVMKEEWLPRLASKPGSGRPDVWINSQKNNEYFPDHTHYNCHLSSVMYLKIPEYLPSRKSYPNRPSEDGALIFTNNTSTGQFWGIPNLQFNPQAGDFFIFPASQLHQVYPFRTLDGKGERRSVTVNALFTSKSEQEWQQNQQKEKTNG